MGGAASSAPKSADSEEEETTLLSLKVLKDDGPPTPKGPAPPGGRLWLMTLFNLMNGTLGPAMFVLPLAFSRTGLFVGVGTCVVLWVFAYVTLLMLLEACSRLRTSSFVTLAKAHSAWMGTAVDISVFFYYYGT